MDVLWCPRCGGRRKILSCLTDPLVVRRILTHLNLPTEPPPVTPAPLIVDDGVDMGVDGDDLTPGPEVNDAGPAWPSPVKGRAPPG